MNLGTVYLKIDSANCPSKAALVASTTSLSSISSAILAQLVLEYLSLIIGIILGLCVAYRDYIGMEIKTEEDDNAQILCHRSKSCVTFFLQIGAFIALMILIAYALKVGNIFNSDMSSCTDPYSATLGFPTIGTLISTVKSNMYTQVAMQVILFLVNIYTFCFVKPYYDQVDEVDEGLATEFKMESDAPSAVRDNSGQAYNYNSGPA